MFPRWMTKRTAKNIDHEHLTIVTVYAAGETKEQVKEENKEWSYKRKLIKQEG